MKNRHLFFVVAAAAIVRLAPGHEASKCPVQPSTLKAMRDCYRPLLVFAPNAHDALFVAQQALLEQYADDMMDRNLLYVPVLTQGAGFEKPLDAPYVLVKQSERNAIRARFQVGVSEFALILVGKDGGEKLRTKKPISVLKLDEVVDAMPMRQQERRSARPHP